MGQNTWTCPIYSCLFMVLTVLSLSHLLLHLFSCIWRLLGYMGCGRLHCEICASGCVVCLICHARANVLFCYDRHLLHLRICSLLPLVLTPFWVLFFPILQRDPNSEGQMQRHLLLAHRRRFLLNFLLYSTVVYTNTMFRHFSTYRI
jgi:hypothetical protein